MFGKDVAAASPRRDDHGWNPETWTDGRTYFVPEWSFLVLDRTTDRAQVAGYLYSGRYEQDWEAIGGSEGYVDYPALREAEAA